MNTRAFSLALAVLAASMGLANGNTFTVVNTNDSGPGSLRQAIMDANGNPGPDIIAFNIAKSGVHTIVLATALPDVTDPVSIDGYSQLAHGGVAASPNT